MYYLQGITNTLVATGSFWGDHTLPWNASTNHTFDLPTIPTGAVGFSRQIVDIVVGAAGQLTFNPDSVSVMKGTILRFDFLGLNHTLTQSSLLHPCLNTSQFDTGFKQFNPSNVSGRFLVDFEVKTEAPQWFYCAQVSLKSHCQAGMVFSLNPGARQNDFVDNARNFTSKAQITPAPAHNFCPSPTGTSLSTRLSTGTMSWAFQKPNVTSILPEISNTGWRVSGGSVHAFGAFLIALGL